MRIKRQFLSNVLGVIVIVWSFMQSVRILGWLVGYKIIGNSFALTSSPWVGVPAMFLFFFDTVAGLSISLMQILEGRPYWDEIMRSILEHVIDFDVTPEKTETK